MSVSYQQVTVTVIVRDEDVEGVKREMHQTLAMLSEEEYKIHQVVVASDVCDDPDEEDEGLYEYEDAA
jgi:hypothetical protein